MRTARRIRRTPWSAKAADPATERLAKFLRKERHRLERRIGAVVNESDPAERSELLHDIRRQAKRMQYAVEAVAPVFGRDADAYATALANIQEVLGAHYDGVVTLAKVRELGLRGSDGAETSLEWAAVDAEARFAALLPRVLKSKRRRWLRVGTAVIMGRLPNETRNLHTNHAEEFPRPQPIR